MKAILTLFIIILLLITGSMYGQIATYTGSGGTSTAVTGYPNETVTILQDVGFGSNTACGSGGLSGKTVNTIWSTYNTTGPHYFIKITPNAGYQLNVTGFSAGMRVSNTGPTKVRYAYSLDNGATWIDDGVDHPVSNPGCGSSIASSWGGGTLPTGIASTANGIIVALFPFAPGGSTGTFQTNYINILGTVTPGCTIPTITVTPSPVSICAGSSTSLTASGAGASGTYTWAPSTGLSATTGATVTANPATTTTYTITGYAAAACSNTTTLTVTVNPLPVAGSIVGADSVCAGSVITLTNPTATAGGTWTSSLTSVATVAGGVVHAVSAGTTSIVYSVTTVCGTVSTLHNVTVNPLPNAGVITGADSVCYGTAITLTDLAPGGSWASSGPSVATVSPLGVVTGLSPTLSTVNITYSSYTFSCGTATATHPVTVKPQPYAGTILGNTTVCKLATTNLASLAPGGVWTSANTAIASVDINNGTVYGVSAGDVVITYSVTNSCGTATDTALVHVNDLPPAIGGVAILCAGVTAVLTNALPAGIWSSSNTAVATIDASGTVYGVSPGLTTITYANSTTNCFITTPITVNLSLPPSISITASTLSSVCAGTPVTYYAHPVNGGTSPLFVWSVNGVIISGGSSYTYTPSDNDIIRCWFISSLGCAVPDTASSTFVMTVHHIATPSLSVITGMGDTVCQGVLTTLTPVQVDGGTAPTYQWFVNLNPVGTGSTYSYIPADGDIIKCIMTSNEYCLTAPTATTTKLLAVSPFVAPVASMASSLGPTTCEGYPVIYTVGQINGGTAPTYQWAVNGAVAGTGGVFTYTPANGDNIVVTLTSNFPCASPSTGTDTMVMTVVPIVQPVGALTAEPGYIINEGAYDTFRINVISGGGLAPTYQWFKDAIPMPGATNTVYITNVLHTGDSISCVVTNTDQCSGISVFNSLHITIGTNVGVHDLTIGKDNFMLYPNPNDGSFLLKGDVEGLVKYEVIDMLGKVLYSNSTSSQAGHIDHEISLNNVLSSGQYILHITTETTTQNIRFIISK